MLSTHHGDNRWCRIPVPNCSGLLYNRGRKTVLDLLHGVNVEGLLLRMLLLLLLLQTADSCLRTAQSNRWGIWCADLARDLSVTLQSRNTKEKEIS